MTEPVDLLITGGTIVDGTGAAARSGDLAIHDGRIREVERASTAADIYSFGSLVILPSRLASRVEDRQ